MKSISRSALTAAALALTLLAPGTALADDASLTTIRFSELGTISVGNLYQYLAIDKEIYKKNGIDLQIVHFLKGGPESIAAAASNQVDMGSVGAPILIAISRGVHLRIVGAPAIKYNPFILVGRPGIRSVADLKGKDVAFGDPGGGSVEAARYIFEANQVDPDSVHNVGGGGITSFYALKAGRIDGAILSEPNVTLAEKEGIGKVLARAEDYLGRYELSYIFATQEFIASHPDAIRRFFIANREAIRYAEAHQDELYAYGLQHIKLDPAVLKIALQNQIARWDDSGRVDEVGMFDAIKVAQGLGDIGPEYKPSLDQIADFRFVDQSDAGLASAGLPPSAGDKIAGPLARK